MNSYKLRKALVKAVDPKAFENPVLKSLDELQIRLASDQDVQRLRREVAVERANVYRKMFLPLFAVNISLYVAAAYFMPGLFDPLAAIIAGGVTSILLAHMCNIFSDYS